MWKCLIDGALRRLQPVIIHTELPHVRCTDINKSYKNYEVLIKWSEQSPKHQFMPFRPNELVINPLWRVVWWTMYLIHWRVLFDVHTTRMVTSALLLRGRGSGTFCRLNCKVVTLLDNSSGVWRHFYSGRGTTALCDACKIAPYRNSLTYLLRLMADLSRY